MPGLADQLSRLDALVPNRRPAATGRAEFIQGAHEALHLGDERPMLVALLADAHDAFRAAAAGGLAGLATAAGKAPSDLVLAGLDQVFALGGALAPLYIVRKLADGRHEGRAGTVARRFAEHRSAHVRAAADGVERERTQGQVGSDPAVAEEQWWLSVG